MSFEIGIKVKLKEEFFLRDSPCEMLVESINDPEISVFWFGADGSKKEAKFDKNFLEEIDSDEEYDSSEGAFFDDGIDEQNGSTVF